MDQWFGEGVEIQCYSIYQGQGLVEEDHLESSQNDRSALRIVRCEATVNSTNPLVVILEAPGNVLEGVWRENS